MAQFKRFNTSENDNYDSSAVYPEGTLTWDPSNGLRIHDGGTSGGNAVGSSNFYDLTNRPTGNTAVHDLQGGSSSEYNGYFLKQTSTGVSEWSALPTTYDTLTIDTKIIGGIDGAAGTQITGIEATLGSGSPYQYAFISGNDAFGNLFNRGSSIIGWKMYPASDPSQFVSITEFLNNDLGAPSLGFSGTLQSGPWVAESSDYNAGSPGPLKLSADSKDWVFGTDGKLKLPAGGDIVDSTGTSVLGGGSGGGTSLPADANGYLRNDGSGTLTWNTSTVTAGSPAYSDVWVVSSKSSEFWTEYTFNGQINQMFDYQGTNNLTVSNQTVYGRPMSSGNRVLVVNDSAINSNSYGIVFEFPSNPSVGDTFIASSVGDSITVNAGSFVVGKTYTIVDVGNTNWMAIGAQYAGQGVSFVATGAGSGTGTASAPEGVERRIYKPAAGQRAKVLSSGGASSSYYFGENETAKAVYIPLGSQMDGQPITWVYVGVIDGTPTWYQMFF